MHNASLAAITTNHAPACQCHRSCASSKQNETQAWEEKRKAEAGRQKQRSAAKTKYEHHKKRNTTQKIIKHQEISSTVFNSQTPTPKQQRDFEEINKRAPQTKKKRTRTQTKHKQQLPVKATLVWSSSALALRAETRLTVYRPIEVARAEELELRDCSAILERA